MNKDNIIGAIGAILIAIPCVQLLVIQWKAEQKLASPCGMTWDNGQALDETDCSYMGGQGWE